MSTYLAQIWGNLQVNEVDLAEVQGGEVAITNLLSCNGPEFVVQLHFSMSQDSPSMAGQRKQISTRNELDSLLFNSTVW